MASNTDLSWQDGDVVECVQAHISTILEVCTSHTAGQGKSETTSEEGIVMARSVVH